MFIADLGFSYRVAGDGLAGEMELTDELRSPDSARPSTAVLATIADVVAGALASQSTAPRIALTSDLSVRDVQPAPGSRLAVRAAILKAGRNLIATETWFHEPGSGKLIALCHATFVVSPRPQDVTVPLVLEQSFGPGAMDRPFADMLGARLIEPGVVELDRVPYVMQPAGTIQGGALALVGELAARTLLGAPITDLDVRYLATIRIGPARTTTTPVSDSTVRVEIRDAGNPGRLASLVIGRAQSHGSEA
jgi:acyl-coenzyme A thioesterase PaaI-like protein